MNEQHLPPSALTGWLAEVSDLYGLGTDVDPDTTVATILDMTKDVAHGVARPAAPLTAFLLGLAAGRRVPSGTPVAVVVTALSRQVQDLAATRAQAAGSTTDHEPGS